MGTNRVRRVRHTSGIQPRRKRKKSVSPGKAAVVAPNLVRALPAESPPEIVCSDLFEVTLADHTKVRGCFALWKRTRHLLGLAFGDHMRAELVHRTLDLRTFPVPDALFTAIKASSSGPSPRARARACCRKASSSR
jgi:hypothetical protein